jgi:hypothetical protein
VGGEVPLTQLPRSVVPHMHRVRSCVAHVEEKIVFRVLKQTCASDTGGVTPSTDAHASGAVPGALSQVIPISAGSRQPLDIAQVEHLKGGVEVALSSPSRRVSVAPAGAQRPAVPSPPHTCPAGHVPHSNVPPHPSGIEPHATLCAAQVVGVQQSP